MTSEPRVEELLATIRRAIDRDINELDARDQRAEPMPPLRGTLQQDPPMLSHSLERDADHNLSSLRHRVQRHKLDVPVEAPPPVSRAASKLYRPLAEDMVRQPPTYAPATPPYYQAPEDDWGLDRSQRYLEAAPTYVEQPQYVPAPIVEQAHDPLMSQQTAYAAQASFQALANSMMAHLGGDEGLQDRARELLRPMLKSWLDDHLPSLVERMVRDEIERVARRGR